MGDKMECFLGLDVKQTDRRCRYRCSCR